MPYDASVIIPVFNAKHTIKKCLDTLLNQKASFIFEIIVVNDGSNDQTSEILKSYSNKITVINQKNTGPAVARNNGAIASKGNILVFTDSDCYFGDNFLQEIMSPIVKDYGKNIVGVQGKYETHQKMAIARFCQQEFEERYNLYRKSIFISMLGTYAAAVRKDIFFELGMFDARFPIASGEDFALSLKIVRHGYRLVFHDSAICYHAHPENIKSYYKKKFVRAFWRNLVYKIYPDKMIRDSHTPQLLKLQVLLSLLLYTQVLYLFSSLIFPKVLYNAASLLFVTLSIHFLASLPLMMQIIKGDSVIAFYTPVYSFIRSFALVNGLIAGFWNIHVRKKLL